MKLKKERKKGILYTQNGYKAINLISEKKGITLLALIITIIVLLILAGVAIKLIVGDKGIFGRGKEAAFKYRMSAMSEQVDLYVGWQVTETRNTDTSGINGGIMLKDMVLGEMLDITEEEITFEISDILTDISSSEKEYVAIYKGEMYYVSNPKVKNNEQQIKWCQETGIPILYYEAPSGVVVINGNYELVKGLYLCTPKLNEGFIKTKTRYMNVDQDGNLVPGNWITDRASESWYDYKNGQWANIYVENNGTDSYYTWIPRYAFKLDQEAQRSDVKFIDVQDDSWIDVAEDGTETKHEWEELEEEGYQIPEAFTTVDDKGQTVKLSGYWVSKYTLGELSNYILDYQMISNIGTISVKDITTNTDKTIAKYTYAINGKIVKESTQPDDYEYTDLKAGDNTINVTALDENGEIIGSMTKVYSPAIVNEPDLTGFNKDTTYYVTWDSNGIEHSEIPITEKAPTAWYEYGAGMWANIVTRNNGQETYYTWIPRYEFTLDQTSQRSTVRFLQGTTTTTSGGSYQIPEAFSFVDENGNKKELTGYWVTKYTLGSEISPRFDTEVMATSSSIKTKGITGSEVSTGQKYMYYINGIYKETKQNAEDYYEYTGLNAGTKYTINIIVRDSKTEEYLGSVTKQITTVEPNTPDLTGFNEQVTYYVTYDQDGEAQIGDKIKNDGSNKPANWYDYSSSKWANIVVKTDTATTYYTWIPRYEFKILSGQYLNTANQRTEVRFLQGTTTTTSEASYQIPEAFSFVDENGNKKELTGYWVTKYTLGEQTE